MPNSYCMLSSKTRKVVNSALLYIGMLLFCTNSLLVSADEALHADEENLYKGDKMGMGVGFGIVKFNSNAKVTDKTTGRSIFIDVEGNLGLPEISHINTIYGAYRFDPKHSVLFGYFGVNRVSNLIGVDKDFGAIKVEGSLSIADRTRFYYLSYGYKLYYDSRSHVTLVAGLNGMDLRYDIEANGQITVGDNIFISQKLLNANVFAPLPLLGLNFGFSFTPKWRVSVKNSLIFGSYNETSAKVLQSSMNVLYKANKHVGVLMGLTYFNASINVDDENELSEIFYGYNGGFIGMHFGF